MWQAPPRTMPGGQPLPSDAAIKLVLVLRLVFHLALRQAEGFALSVLRLFKQELRVPDHITLSRRSRSFAGRQPKVVLNSPIHLVIDSTGLKLFGQGEWDGGERCDPTRTSRTRRFGRLDARGWCLKLYASELCAARLRPEDLALASRAARAVLAEPRPALVPAVALLGSSAEAAVPAGALTLTAYWWEGADLYCGLAPLRPALPGARPQRPSGVDGRAGPTRPRNPRLAESDA
ncbi:transposase [Belnapia moabensis]|uniref:transposase n=1 Tax=Belnapia moabensis TaxID=365533 RepID=UPI001FE20083